MPRTICGDLCKLDRGTLGTLDAILAQLMPRGRALLPCQQTNDSLGADGVYRYPIPKKNADPEPILQSLDDLLTITGCEDEIDLSFYLDKAVDAECLIDNEDPLSISVGGPSQEIEFPTTLSSLIQELKDLLIQTEAWCEEAGEERPLRLSERKRDSLPKELLLAEFDSWLNLKMFLGCRDHIEFVDWLDPEDKHDLVIFPAFDELIAMIGDWRYHIEFPTNLATIIRAIEVQSPDDDLRSKMIPHRVERPGGHDVRLTTKNLKVAGIDLDFDVRNNGKVLGTLSVSTGGLRWRPAHYQKRNAWVVDWEAFDQWVRQQAAG